MAHWEKTVTENYFFQYMDTYEIIYTQKKDLALKKFRRGWYAIKENN